MEKLTGEERKKAIDVNQKMVSEWMRECKVDGYCAMFMVCVDMNEPDILKAIRLFSSEGMPIPAVIRNLKHIVNMMEQNNYRPADGSVVGI